MSAASRVAHRLRQFWNALPIPRQPVETEDLLAYLTPAQVALFRRMQPSEQAHAYRMLGSLKATGASDPDLLAAALLHDAGKMLRPLSLFDRVAVVLGKELFKNNARKWGEGKSSGLRGAFAVADQHPAWGAELAEKAGASARSVELIRRHQEAAPHHDPLLAALQAADDEIQETRKP